MAKVEFLVLVGIIVFLVLWLECSAAFLGLRAGYAYHRSDKGDGHMKEFFGMHRWACGGGTCPFRYKPWTSRSLDVRTYCLDFLAC